MYECGKVKKVLGNKIAITIYSWTLCWSPQQDPRKPPVSHMYSDQKVLSITGRQNTQLFMKNLNILSKFSNFEHLSPITQSISKISKKQLLFYLFSCKVFFGVGTWDSTSETALLFIYYWNGFMLPLLQFSSSELSPQLLVPSHCKVMGISPQEHGKTSAFLSVIKKWIALY